MTTMSNLVSLVYVSSATHLLSVAEMDYLIEQAHQRNVSVGITSLLLYNGGNFMQCLEGPAAQVDKAMQTIYAHPSHRSLIELFREPITIRAFAQWPMAFLDIDGHGLSTPRVETAHVHAKLALRVDTQVSRSEKLMAAFYRTSLGLH